MAKKATTKPAEHGRACACSSCITLGALEWAALPKPSAEPPKATGVDFSPFNVFRRKT